MGFVDLGPFLYEEPTEEEEKEARRYESRLRDHCPTCGRFAKPGAPTRQNWQGEYEWSVICLAHGEQWIR